jgi:hypothetical protein
MRSPEPPTLATWVLEHLLPGKKNEALTGDLLEEFRSGRSVAWCWRQVFGVIFASLSRKLCAQRGVTRYEIAWTFGFASVWTSIVPAYESLILRSLLFRSLNLWIFEQPRTEWLVYQFSLSFGVSVLIVISTVGLYLGTVCNFEFARFRRGLLFGLLGAFISNAFATMLIETNLRLVSRLVWWFGWGFYEYGFRWLPIALAVQMSIWAARSAIVHQNASLKT